MERWILLNSLCCFANIMAAILGKSFPYIAHFLLAMLRIPIVLIFLMACQLCTPPITYYVYNVYLTLIAYWTTLPQSIIMSIYSLEFIDTAAITSRGSVRSSWSVSSSLIFKSWKLWFVNLVNLNTTCGLEDMWNRFLDSKPWQNVVVFFSSFSPLGFFDC